MHMPFSRPFLRGKSASVSAVHVPIAIPSFSRTHQPETKRTQSERTRTERPKTDDRRKTATPNNSTHTVPTPHPGSIPASLPTPPTTPPIPQFTLLAHHQPASWTIALLLEELGLTYTLIPVGVRVPGLIDVDSHDNMRIPALVDHSNKDIVLTETGAVVLYLVERYGQGVGIGEGSSLVPEAEADKALARQWLFFSMTEHAPSFTSATHFLYEHPQKLPTAISHTTTLVHRALTTLNTSLSRTPTGYLVPGHGHHGPSYADLVFWSWNWMYESGGFPAFVDGDDEEQDDCWRRYPAVGEWQRRMDGRESVRRVVEEWERVKLEYV